MKKQGFSSKSWLQSMHLWKIESTQMWRLENAPCSQRLCSICLSHASLHTCPLQIVILYNACQTQGRKRCSTLFYTWTNCFGQTIMWPFESRLTERGAQGNSQTLCYKVSHLWLVSQFSCLSYISLKCHHDPECRLALQVSAQAKNSIA